MVATTVEAKVRKIRVAKTKIKGNKIRTSGEKRGKGAEEKAEKGKDNGNKKDSRKVENLGQGRRSSKIRERSEEIGSRTIS